MEKETLHPSDENPCEIYARLRNALYQSGKKIEILVNFNPKLHYFAEWWKQLYGESEGKDGKGIFPASVDFTTDLHSIANGFSKASAQSSRLFFQLRKPAITRRIPEDSANLDGINYLAGKRIDEVNKMAELGTKIAHADGGVPNIKIEINKLDEHTLGQLIYFFEKACGISGYLLGVNPFNQPGVEAYKKNMFALLEKPATRMRQQSNQSQIEIIRNLQDLINDIFANQIISIKMGFHQEEAHFCHMPISAYLIITLQALLQSLFRSSRYKVLLKACRHQPCARRLYTLLSLQVHTDSRFQ